MQELINSLEINGFRGLSHLQIPALGKVNLITGKNNAGKSSLLEAIRILVTRAPFWVLQSILDYREELGEPVDSERESPQVDFGSYRNLFSGFPDLERHPARFTMSAAGRGFKNFPNLSVKAVWAVKIADPNRSIYGYERVPSEYVGMVDAVPALEYMTGKQHRLVPIPSGGPRHSLLVSPFKDTLSDSLRCVFLDPFSSRSTHQMGVFWDAIALTDAESEVLKALQLIAPDIQGISMVGNSESRLSARTAIVRSSRFENPVPLRSFGDGVNRLFGIVLSLCNARQGVLLVDEIENGLHYSAQVAVWNTIFRLASDLDVQVFATSHSHDCVEAFQKAAYDSKHKGMLVRLTRKDEAVIPTLFGAKELAIASRNEIEVR